MGPSLEGVKTITKRHVHANTAVAESERVHTFGYSIYLVFVFGCR